MSAQSGVGFDKAVAAFGTQQRMALALGVTEGRVSQWRRTGVPLGRCIELESLTRRMAAERHDPSLVVACEDLRPEHDWHVLRENPRRAG